jgi:hypothetical protein
MLLIIPDELLEKIVVQLARTADVVSNFGLRAPLSAEGLSIHGLVALQVPWTAVSMASAFGMFSRAPDPVVHVPSIFASVRADAFESNMAALCTVHVVLGPRAAVLAYFAGPDWPLALPARAERPGRRGHHRTSCTWARDVAEGTGWWLQRSSV